MNTYIALLRGINIIGKKKLPMADLREICGRIGLTDAVTYIQSGNIVFASGLDPQEIELRLHDEIANDFGYDISILVRTPNFFKRLIAANPYADSDPKSLHVTILGSKPEAGLVEAISEGEYGVDGFEIRGDVVYLHCPDGYGRTKLHNNFFERKLKVSATTRNWRTTRKLLEIAQDH